MKLEITGLSGEEQIQSDAVIVFVYEGKQTELPEFKYLHSAVVEQINAGVRSADFTGKLNQTVKIIPSCGSVSVIVPVGLGKQESLEPIRLRRAASAAMRVMLSMNVSSVVLYLPPTPLGSEATLRLAISGAVFGAYQFTAYKTESSGKSIPSSLSVVINTEDPEKYAAIAREELTIAESTNWARDLGNTPPNELFPAALADHAKKMAAQTGLRCKIFTEKDLRRIKANLITAVGSGSQHAPRMVVMKHHCENSQDKPIILAGKGVTFDTGGTNLKPSASLESMKYDMTGAAAVFGVMRAVSLLDLPVPVVGICPLAENHLGGKSQRTGDIIRSMASLTVEINNTDAEGRLLLADALTYAAKKFSPSCMIDIATLTGACVTALGHHCASLTGNNQPLADALITQGHHTGERLWQLPLWDDYAEQLKSHHADLSNIGGKCGSAITGGSFISRFVRNIPWAHIDIAGVADTNQEKPWMAAGATGFGVSVLVKYIIKNNVEFG